MELLIVMIPRFDLVTSILSVRPRYSVEEITFGKILLTHIQASNCFL